VRFLFAINTYKGTFVTWATSYSYKRAYGVTRNRNYIVCRSIMSYVVWLLLLTHDIFGFIFNGSLHTFYEFFSSLSVAKWCVLQFDFSGRLSLLYLLFFIEFPKPLIAIEYSNCSVIFAKKNCGYAEFFVRFRWIGAIDCRR
jgi:flagellar biosynthesis protein FliR